MPSPRPRLRRPAWAILCGLAAALALGGPGAASQSPRLDRAPASDGAHHVRVTLVYQHAIPGVPGKSVKGVLVEYGPGASSPSHRHAKSALIYATVLQGSIRSKVNDQPERIYRAGDNWTEMPGDHHLVSANASRTEPARLLAVFIVDDQDRELTIPDTKQPASPAGMPPGR